jgi:hypothetical protein
MRKLRQMGDPDAAFGPWLLAAAHGLCHDMVGGRQADQPGESGSGPPQEEVRDASLRLPERQREALALRGLARLSYEEIGATMEMNDHSVAQLISRARINLYDELRGTALASVAPPTPQCERALPLIAARDDGQLEASSVDAAWLDGHLAGCDRCRLAVEQMREACVSYNSWAPIAAVPWLLGETMAKAAELVGADWSGEIAQASSQAQAESPIATPRAHPAGQGSGTSRRAAIVVVAIAALFLLVGVAAALVGDSGSATPAAPVAGAAAKKSSLVSEPGPGSRKGRRVRGGAAKEKRRRTAAKVSTGSAQTAGGETQTPAFVPAQATSAGGAPSGPASGRNRSSGKTALQPTQQTAASGTSKPSSKPKPAPAPTTASQPAAEAPPPAATTPSAESSPPPEEAPEKPGRSGEAPGKPADHPSR